MRVSSDAVVLSSPYTSSPTVAFRMASSIGALGFVTVSDRKSSSRRAASRGALQRIAEFLQC